MYTNHLEVAKKVKDGTFFYQRLVKTLVIPIGMIDGPETHSVQQASVVLSGQGLLKSNKEVRSLTSGSYFLIEPDVTHEIENDGYENLVILNFYSGNNH